MALVPALLDEYADELKRLCDADGCTVLLHMEPLDRDSLLLSAVGANPIPEFGSIERAWKFLTADSAREARLSGKPTRLVSDADGGIALFYPLSGILPRPDQVAPEIGERRAHPVVHTAPALDGGLWIGLSRAARPERLAHSPAEARGESEAASLARFLTLASKLAWQVYHFSRSLQDPVSQLPGRKEFETFLKRALAAGKANGQPLAVLLINADDFVMVNHRFGREEGDLAVREIAARLAGSVRETDGVFRYGGAAFGLVLPATDEDSSDVAARKFKRLLSEQSYLKGRLKLEFTVGGAIADMDYLLSRKANPLELIQRADIALNQAKLAGGGQMTLSAMSDSAEGLSHFDPLTGIFTTDSEKDYRNMSLLWEAVALVSANPEPEQLGRAFVERLGNRFRPDRLALMRMDDKGQPRPIATSLRNDDDAEGRLLGQSLRLAEAQTSLIQAALNSGKLERKHHGAEDAPRGTTSFAVPLIASGKSVGCLFLDGQNSRFQLDATDLMFINALASQLAIALDRAELSVSWIREKDQESRQLREEVRELREAMNPHRPVFASAQMQEQMALIQRIAPSEATVLIIGESGTGKEMLAHSVHEFGDRSERPFVTVDCGAISHSLLEAELFGHVKGAYTGAESASDGRIVQADGGTLFLDEIGELPLDVQAKLLRFVQEREIVPVGGTQSRRVDVRIVAATNRELKDEVARGRFRQDLYYRLQVVPVMAQPLRERPDDILPLAKAFLDRFAAQNNRQCDSFTRDAEALLLQHHWPGNVRELQHAILRAVLLSDGPRIGAEDIELLPEAEPDAFPTQAVESTPVGTAQAEAPAEDLDVGMAMTMSGLRAELERQVTQALKDNARRPVPVGKWLQEDMVIALNAACGQVSRRAARVAGVPESTFRRQLDKARGDAEAGLAVRTEAWVVMGRILRDLANASTEDDGVPLLDAVRGTLLEVVLEQSGNRNSVGAALMGVSPPTFKRWLEDRAA